MYTYSGLQCWQATLLGPLAQEGVAPALPPGQASTLCAVLSNGSHTYLVLTAPGLGCEIVKATCSFGTVLLERGQDGTAAHAWPAGSCIEWALVGAAVKELIEQAEACPTDCIPATIVSGAQLPDGVQGTLYTHRIVIGGTPPFALGLSMVPAWMVVTLDGGEIRLEGTPPGPGAFNVSIPLKSCGVLSEFFRGCGYIAPAAEGEGG